MSNLAQDRILSPRALGLRASPIVAAGLVACLLLFTAEPWPQSLDYHRFKDDRTLLGLPNALNVLSNLPFLVVGAWGLWYLLAGAGSELGRAFRTSAERWPFVALFAGVALTGFGSSIYHLDPNNARLVWDRLPMAIGFMGLIDALIAERISPRLAIWMLPPLLALGVGSVWQWHWTERHGRGDLRLYFFVQGYALFFALVVPLLYPPRYTRTADWYIALGLYALAKVCEALDGPIYTALGRVVSGHTLKHLLGAASTYWLLHMLKARRPLVALSSLPGRKGGEKIS
jgi:hypothetical protein